ncbi:DUF1905 domain-containing protein [Erythrobacter oryzae]|uniref:DUF1905 domain-containing protein n=1 Tax=Erythrobacter oryzae TaxID=3019556 RepID=UPI002556F76D|nr:DUF1905 domain-containing protein [Erythrobacter sp. COR-2]
MSRDIRFAGTVETVFIEEGFDPAYFVALPDAANAEVAAITLADGGKRAFGAVRVEARIGASVWSTKLNAKAGAWTLPIRKPVRLAEELAEGMMVEVVLRVL